MNKKQYIVLGSDGNCFGIFESLAEANVNVKETLAEIPQVPGRIEMREIRVYEAREIAHFEARVNEKYYKDKSEQHD